MQKPRREFAKGNTGRAGGASGVRDDNASGDEERLVTLDICESESCVDEFSLRNNVSSGHRWLRADDEEADMAQQVQRFFCCRDRSGTL